MITTAHPVAAEQLMALLDGELPVDEARAISAHLEHCVGCAEVAGQFRGVSRSLAGWTAPDASSSLEKSVMAKLAQRPHSASSGHRVRLNVSNWGPWAVGGGGAVAVALFLVAVGVSISYFENRPRRIQSFINPQPPPSSSAYGYSMEGGSSRRTLTEQSLPEMPAEPMPASPMAATVPGTA
jgi:anti-sigma factor RsiW